MMLWKCCTQYSSKFGKLSSGHRTGKGQFSFQSQRQCQRMFKLLHNCTHLICWQSNAQNSPNQASAICEPWTSWCSSWFSKRQRNQRSNCQHPLDHRKSESSRKTSISALLTMPKPLTALLTIPKPLTVWITIICGKFWKRREYQTTWSASWEICMQVRKQQLELDMEQRTGSK